VNFLAKLKSVRFSAHRTAADFGCSALSSTNAAARRGPARRGHSILGTNVREDLQEHRVDRASICFVKFDGIVFVLTNAAKLYCPAEYFEQALTQSLTSGRKELLLSHRRP
jgi:hypothetical protein